MKYVSEKDFQEYVKTHPDRCFVTYKQDVFDMTNFLEDHPGGDKFIQDQNGKDITQLFHGPEPHSHSKSAFRMMGQYKIGELTYYDSSTDAGSNSSDTYPKIDDNYIYYNGFKMDRNQGLIPQTLGLNKQQYLEFVHQPLHLDNVMLFKWKFFEFFTRNKWWYIPLVWVPISFAVLAFGIVTNFGSEDTNRFDKYIYVESPSFNVLGPLLGFLWGMFMWTFIEYMLHRYLFHMSETLLNFKAFRYIHFMVHGIHHIIPMDPDRLVFPPPLAAVLAIGIYPMFVAGYGGNFARVSFAGGLFMYILYDYFHWWLHHGKGGLNYFKELKRYHNLHHYFDEDAGYGITSKLWDYVFFTVIKEGKKKAE